MVQIENFVLYYIAHLRQKCHGSKFVIFQEKLLKGMKCYNFLSVQRRHNRSPAASFANRVMTLHLLKVHPRTFLSVRITKKKCQILSCDTLVANELYIIKVCKRIAQSVALVNRKFLFYFYFFLLILM